MSLKLVLVSPNGTIFQHGKASNKILDDLILLIKRLESKGVATALWSRHRTTVGDNDSLEDFLSRRSGTKVRQYRAASGNLPARQYKGSADPILDDLKLKRHQVVLVGNGERDMQAGVNNGFLLLRPEWYDTDLDYGLSISSIGDLAQFCELFALRAHPIYWSVDTKSTQLRAMGPYSTFIPDFATFGTDAREAAKHDGGARLFWYSMIVSTLYFSGLIHDVDYMCAYPGHDPKALSAVRVGLDAVMSTLGKCFRKTYLPDLVVRHKSAVKSQYAKAEQKTFLNQLNTIHLNRHPRSYQGPPRKTPISLRGKTVLVVDDFCTNGRSLDCASAYIEAAGGQAVMFSWLKTINTPFLHMMPRPDLAPFQINTFKKEPASIEFPYGKHIIDRPAAAEIDKLFKAYKKWKWP